MGVFPRIGGLINLNTQQSREEEEKSYAREKKYQNEEEDWKQQDLWYEAEKKHPWYDAPPKVKVTSRKGLCHMNIEFTMGLMPYAAYFFLTSPGSKPFFDIDKKRDVLETKSKKVLMEDGPRQIAKSKITLVRDFLGLSIPIPMTLIVDENIKDLTGKYKKEKMMFMKVFEGNWKVEPIYVDAERLCKHRLPKNREEYKKCSGGQGKIAAKVIMNQYFEPYPLFNFPPLSSYIRKTTINTTKTLLKLLQETGKSQREAERNF